MRSFYKSRFRSLTRENREASGKRSQAFEYVLKYSGRFTTEKQYANIILRSNPDGEILRKDVANIEFSSMYDIYSNLNGKTIGNCIKQPLVVMQIKLLKM
jgi:multidrug efflux pump subunit AcrB